MHPEVVRSEPAVARSAHGPGARNAPAEDNAELMDMTRRFWVSGAGLAGVS